MEGGVSAVISPCGTYRYLLTRVIPQAVRWVRPVTFVMLNPSTADATQDDPTIRRCIGFAKAWGCTELRVVNLFAFRATEPNELYLWKDRIGVENDTYISSATVGASIIVAAWGAHRIATERGAAVMALLASHDRAPVQCLGRTRGGAPRHPLYVPRDQKREDFFFSALGGGAA